VLLIFLGRHIKTHKITEKVGTVWGLDMVYKWLSTKFPGVRYRTHPTRKYANKPDKYFAIRYQAKGKRKEEGLGWSSEKWTAEKAALALAELKKAHTTGEGPARLTEKREIERIRREKEKQDNERLEKENITFQNYFSETYSPISKGSKKLESHKRELQNFEHWIKPVLGEVPFKNISPFHIEKIKKNMLTAEMTPRTIQYAFATIRQVWNMAKRDGLVNTDSPTKQVKVPKIDNRRLRFLTREEADILLENLRNRSLQLHNMALLSLHCGLRAGEIFNLTWGDVDLERGILTLRDSKSGKTRRAFMTEKVKSVFNKPDYAKHDDLVFPDRDDNKMKRISNAFQRAVNELGFNNGISDPRQQVVFHTLRHTFASWLVENGTDLYIVKELMGHSTLAMTERYSHLGQNTLQSAVRNLEKSLSTELAEPLHSNKLKP